MAVRAYFTFCGWGSYTPAGRCPEYTKSDTIEALNLIQSFRLDANFLRTKEQELRRQSPGVWQMNPAWLKNSWPLGRRSSDGQNSVGKW